MGESKIVFVGRLEKDTGLLKFLEWLDLQKIRWSVDFVGDGSLSDECKKYGKVHGFTDPLPYYRKADFCIPAGYMSYIESKKYGCKIKVFWDNPLKRDYWREIMKIRKFPSWDQIADEYINLYNSTK